MDETKIMNFVDKAVADVGGLREIVISAGFSPLRRVAETPLNIVVEVKA